MKDLEKRYSDMFAHSFDVDTERIIAETETGIYVDHPECHTDKTALDIVHEIENSDRPVGLFDYPGGFKQFKKDAIAGKI